MMLLARGFGHNGLVTSLAPQRDVHRREENIHNSLQELDSTLTGMTIEAEFQSIRNTFATVQRRISMIEEKFDDKLETILSELEKMTEMVKQPSQKRLSNQRGFVEALIE
jgi:vacuolar-type H+-ATPase subunit E/Vma4